MYAQDGEKIGAVEEVFVDEATGHPEWIGLGTGLFGMKRVLVPVQGAAMVENQVTVPYSKEQVKETPDIDSGDISIETERRLYFHYGLDYSEQRSATGLPATGGDAHEAVETGSQEETLTRSEEELRVGKREEEVGRLRVEKWTETEQVDVPVELRRERARVTREPVDQKVGGEIGEDSLEVTLSEERPVVEKETVAKERIGIEKDVEVETETVSDEVRKERVDIDEDASR